MNNKVRRIESPLLHTKDNKINFEPESKQGSATQNRDIGRDRRRERDKSTPSRVIEIRWGPCPKGDVWKKEGSRRNARHDIPVS